MSKYKWVKFTESDKTELTIESDNELEFRKAVESFGGRLTKTLVEEDKTSRPKETAPRQTADQYQDKVDNGVCPIHNVKMVEKMSKTTNKPYKSHTEGRGDDFKICFGKGWKE